MSDLYSDVNDDVYDEEDVDYDEDEDDEDYDEDEEESDDDASDEMDDSLSSKPKSLINNAYGVNYSKNIREQWVVIRTFNFSGPVLEKKNSKDGLMDNVCDAVMNLLPNLIHGNKYNPGMFKTAIDRCNDYIENKHPWLPKGKRRKQAVINLRDALTDIAYCDEPDMVMQTIALYEASGSGDDKGLGIGENQYTTLYNNMKANKLKNQEYARRISKSDTFSKTELSQAKMIRMMKDNGYYSGGAQGENRDKVKEWLASYNKNGVERGKAMEPVLEIIMKTKPESFIIEYARKVDPADFTAKFRILELAQVADVDVDTYAEYIKADPNAKFAKNFEEVLTKVKYLANLYDLYDNLSLVIMNPQYARTGAQALNLLKFKADALNEMYLKKERAGGNMLNVALLRNLTLTKEFMEKNNYYFGVTKNFSRLMAKARQQAAEEMAEYGS